MRHVLLAVALAACGSKAAPAPSSPSSPSAEPAPISNVAAEPPPPAAPATTGVRGMIKAHPKASDRIATGGVLFVIMKKAGEDGAPIGPPLAVDKLAWAPGGIAFELDERHTMLAGTRIEGNVILTVRYDQDGDAMSKEPGDVIGTTRVTVPADQVVVTLDDILP